MKAGFAALLMFFTAVAGFGKSPQHSPEIWAASATNILGSVEIRAQAERIDSLISAFNATLEDLGYFRTDSRVKPIEAVLTYRGEGDERITVKLKEFADFTYIKLRCGIIGNGALSRAILERIYARF